MPKTRLATSLAVLCAIGALGASAYVSTAADAPSRDALTAPLGSTKGSIVGAGHWLPEVDDEVLV